MTLARLCPIVALGLLAAGPPAKAQNVFQLFRTTECEWAKALPEIRRDTDYANGLLHLKCDAELSAAMRSRFAYTDAESLALYNRGIIAPGHAPALPPADPTTTAAAPARSRLNGRRR